MKDLKQIIRKLKSRLKMNEFYNYVLKDIYYNIFSHDLCYQYLFNTINLNRVIEYSYHNYFISSDNIEDVSTNIIERIAGKYLFIRGDEYEIYWFKTFTILNNYHSKQSKLFNSVIQKNPEFKNLINELTQVRLKDYIIDINFIYTLLHPDSVIYKYIKSNSYDKVLDKLVDDIINQGFATKIDLIMKDITTPVDKENHNTYKFIPFDDSLLDIDEACESDMDFNTLYKAFINDVDILSDVYKEEQLSDSFIDDFHLKDYQLYEHVDSAK